MLFFVNADAALLGDSGGVDTVDVLGLREQPGDGGVADEVGFALGKGPGVGEAVAAVVVEGPQVTVLDRQAVEPQDPPKTCQRSIPRCSRIFSISATRSQVVFASRDA